MSMDILNNETITYDQSKELARHEDPKVRQALAKRKDLKQEILYYLAEDTDPEVRKTVAQNAAAPRQTDILLAKDADADVRGDLAEKIARIAPGLSADEQDKAHRATYEALERCGNFPATTTIPWAFPSASQCLIPKPVNRSTI